jgi:ABC-type multidrug transport system fused ATPase/permease subunit
MCLATLAQIFASVIMLAIVYPYVYLCTRYTLTLCSHSLRHSYFLVPIALAIFLFYRTSSFYRHTSTTFKRHDNVLRSSLYAWFGESLTGMSTIRAFKEQDRFREGNEKFLDLENRYVELFLPSYSL